MVKEVSRKEYAMATVEEGGYDYDFVEPPPEGLLCKICQLPCREAQSSEGHVYCKRCISTTKPSASVSYSCNNEVLLNAMYIDGSRYKGFENLLSEQEGWVWLDRRNSTR